MGSLAVPGRVTIGKPVKVSSALLLAYLVLLAALGVAGLFGFIRVSELMDAVDDAIRGRLLVFFPGEYDGNIYRLLDARDGWNYLAVPITAAERT